MQDADIKKEQKKALRKEVKALRAAHTDEEIHRMSLELLPKAESLPEYHEAQLILAYIDCKHEVETMDLIRRALAEGKKVAAPKVFGQEMTFFYLSDPDTDLEAGYYGIREPKEGLTPIDDKAEALMLMPGVAFDEARHRTGYGGGFYDRYLEAHPQLKTVALAFEFQVKTEVPYEAFDIRPMKIVTEKRVIE